MAENCKKALLIGYEDIVEVDVGGLDDLQRLVGGYIDVVDLPLFGRDVQATLYVNDEGIYTHSPNRAIAATAELEEGGYLSAVTGKPVACGELYTVLWGPIVAIGFDPETGEDKSLTAGEMQAVEAYFSHPASMPGSGWVACEQVARLEAQGGLR